METHMQRTTALRARRWTAKCRTGIASRLGIISRHELVGRARRTLDSVARLERHLADPGTVTLYATLFQAWGRRPR